MSNPAIDASARRRSRRSLSERWLRSIGWFIARQPVATGGAVLLLLMIFAAVAAPLLRTSDPTAISPVDRLLPPSALHWFGTDMLGRDLYSRVIYGARVSLLVGFSVALLASIIGIVVGLAAGFIRGIDSILMRIMDGLMAIPSLLLAIALMAITQPSLQNVIMAITVSEAPRMTRLVRGVVISIREQPYIEAAVGSGARTVRIIARHILPNALAPTIIQATFICASAMISEAVLSFIGAGTPAIIPSWGNIMSEGRAVWQVKPYVVLFPALFISITMLSVNVLGDGLRDALDPKMKGRD